MALNYYAARVTVFQWHATITREVAVRALMLCLGRISVRARYERQGQAQSFAPAEHDSVARACTINVAAAAPLVVLFGTGSAFRLLLPRSEATRLEF